MVICRGSFIASVSSVSSTRRRSRRPSSSGPKTARITTSWVIACIRGQSWKGSPTGQRPTSRRATSAIISASASMLCRWKGGSISLRRRMCSGSSSSITERGPSTGSSIGLALSTPTFSPAVKTALTSSGSQSKTQSPQWRMRRVKMSP